MWIIWEFYSKFGFTDCFYMLVLTSITISILIYQESILYFIIKTICKPEFTIEFPDNPHSVSVQDPSKYIDSKRNVITGPFNKNESVDIIQINHYHGKSIEEQKTKQQLGTPDKISKDYVPTYHTENNDIKDDLLPNQYLDEIVRIYNNL